MSLKKLVRESEPYSRYGNISADGIQRLLGTPNVDRLQTVIRETVQNSWDARRNGETSEFRVAIRKLSKPEKRVLKEKVFADLPFEGDGEHPVSGCLNDNDSVVLEVSDFGTCGLGGPTRPDESPHDDESPDFVDFMRNIGTPRDTEHGGGTYGYGKSSLYAMSRCQTILVHTVTRYRGGIVRRLMGARVAHRFDIESGKGKGRYTGRHWWGVNNGGESLEPLTGEDARKMAESLGLAQRSDSDLGTTIMMLMPDFRDTPVSGIVKRMLETLLWNFWPKMLAHDGDSPSMKFSVEVNGAAVPVPRVEDCPPLDLFADAMKRLKKEGVPENEIRSKRPSKRLGAMKIERGLKGERNHLFVGGDSLAPDPSCHVALMRPAELVVKYIEGQALAKDSYEWGGVFVCDDHEEVEKAFAASEPPAHDDWIPNYLPKGNQKTFVNVALREIKRCMRDYSAPRPPKGGEGDGSSLGLVGDALGGMMFGAGGQGIGGNGKRQTGKGKKPRKAVKLERPQFLKLEELDGALCALFEMKLLGPKGQQVSIAGRPGIVTDGGGSDYEMPDGSQPEIVEWRDDEGATIGSGARLEAVCDKESTIRALISMPGYVAVSFTANIEDR